MSLHFTYNRIPNFSNPVSWFNGEIQLIGFPHSLTPNVWENFGI
jgi:hypothetical protein